MFQLTPLPYAQGALAPVISERTLQFHHGKHHAAYVKTLNELLEKKGDKPKSLEEVIVEAGRSGEAKLFNNAAQAWNHAFFWESMRPAGGAAPGGELARLIQDFGGQQALNDAFVEEGFGHFASGWVWLVTGSDGLKVISTHDAEDTLIREGLFPLLVCDVWEHAYYLDYKNDRKAFLERWFESLANWDFAAAQLAAADGSGAGFRYPAPKAEAAERGKGEAPRPTA